MTSQLEKLARTEDKEVTVAAFVGFDLAPLSQSPHRHRDLCPPAPPGQGNLHEDERVTVTVLDGSDLGPAASISVSITVTSLP
ncbi:MAG TPA: hypothetical protein VFG76_08245 [Candidatus Polarisedimenticolia bacterium]|nr:hypothetical protein [Candidatus Polarisedimenticolia bacterium]